MKTTSLTNAGELYQVSPVVVYIEVFEAVYLSGLLPLGDQVSSRVYQSRERINGVLCDL
jgi:hypothetical protein